MEFEQLQLKKQELDRREKMEQEQLELKRQELDRQISRDKIEDERRDSSVAKGKLLAMR